MPNRTSGNGLKLKERFKLGVEKKFFPSAGTVNAEAC